MSKAHLAFKNFRPEVIEATNNLFALKPWATEDREAQAAAAQAWLDVACTTYDLPPVEFRWSLFGGDIEYRPAFASDVPSLIKASKFSLINLFTAFGQHRGNFKPGSKSGRNPSGWGCSLFYTVKPKMFRARVREGRIQWVTPKDLYSAETWGRIRAAGLDPTQRGVLSTLARIDAGEETGFGSHVSLSAADESDALAAMNDEPGMTMTASSVTPPPDVASEIGEAQDEEFDGNDDDRSNADDDEAEDTTPVEEVTESRAFLDLLNELSITTLRKLSRGRFSGGYGMKKPELVAALVSGGVTAEDVETVLAVAE